MTFYYKHSYILVATICLIISLSQATKINAAIIVDLIHRDSPVSPFYDPSQTRFDRITNSFRRSFSRSLNLAKSFYSTSNSPQAPLTPIPGEYLMKIRIGTPPVEILAIVDTGSDLTWTQCLPCPECYKQEAPLFDPKNSKTYTNVSCNSLECQLSDSLDCSENATSCKYDVLYQNYSFSRGDRRRFQRKNFRHRGLGGGRVSIVRQLEKSIEEAYDTFYYAAIEGFSVGKKKLEYNYSVSKSDSNKASLGQIIIDSGTTLTVLPRYLYQGLESAMEKAIINGKRVTDPRGFIDGLCYEVGSNGGLKFPPVIAHFLGGDLVLPEETTFVEVKKGVVCLSLVATDGSTASILGNLQQRNYLIEFDLDNHNLNFLPTDCTKLH
ncbi:hypothetical protein DH2020_029072 [Rehmannia glutinosa]|uniref:Peptidase A1 domain-containing protein n=1 Tax=Rehmannia glutinosa TaxID=99300 RepID=A0ABR0VTV6_REHGL